MKKLILFIIFLTVCFSLSAEEISMDFRNQSIQDIIYALSEMEGKTIFFDESVKGNATFFFKDSDFDSALDRFAKAYGLYVEKQNGVYNISRVKIIVSSDKKVTVTAEEVPADVFLRILSRKVGMTIMFDSFQTTNVTIRVQGAKIRDVLSSVCVRLPGFDIEEISGGYYLYKSIGQGARRTGEYFKIENKDGSFSVNIQKGSFTAVIDDLFKKGKKEYVLHIKPTTPFENLRFENKSFNELLSLLLSSVPADFSIKDGVYNIFETEKRNIIKGFKETKTIGLKNISAERLFSLMPQELNNQSVIKADKSTNTIYITGSSTETQAVEKFIREADTKDKKSKFARFDLRNVSVSEIQNAIPKALLISDIIVLSDSNSFIAEINESNESKLKDFIDMIDSKNGSWPVKLKYIKAEELLKHLPPSVDKSKIYETGDDSSIFFQGTVKQYDDFKKELSLIDVPKKQIRYQILVVQRQKTDGLSWNPNMKFNSNEDKEKSGTYSYGGSISNMLSINFDIISKFGLQFAAGLNAEIDEGLSHVLADTTLNAISGESVKFSNTGTYRYRDIVIEGTTDRYTSTTREITSGLTLNIEGWVSGDGMITTSVDAVVSKQSATPTSSTDTSNPPSTTEKKVSTTVRTKSGEPVIIGGLLEQDDDISESRVPGFGAVPVLGMAFKKKNVQRSDTEFVIYLVPFVEKNKSEKRNVRKNIERLSEKYAGGNE